MKLFGIQVSPRTLFRGVDRQGAEVKERGATAELRDTFVLASALDGAARSPRSMPKGATWPFDKWLDVYHDADPKREGSAVVSGAALPALRWPLAVATRSMLRARSGPNRRADIAEFLSALDPERAWGGRHAQYFDPLRFMSLASPPAG